MSGGTNLATGSDCFVACSCNDRIEPCSGSPPLVIGISGPAAQLAQRAIERLGEMRQAIILTCTEPGCVWKEELGVSFGRRSGRRFSIGC
jgi:hypothetical protein